MSVAIGARIRKWRKYRRLSQHKCSKTLGLSTSTISKIETGNRGVSAELMREFARALSVPIQRLYEKDPPKSGAVRR